MAETKERGGEVRGSQDNVKDLVAASMGPSCSAAVVYLATTINEIV